MNMTKARMQTRMDWMEKEMARHRDEMWKAVQSEQEMRNALTRLQSEACQKGEEEGQAELVAAWERLEGAAEWGVQLGILTDTPFARRRWVEEGICG